MSYTRKIETEVTYKIGLDENPNGIVVTYSPEHRDLRVVSTLGHPIIVTVAQLDEILDDIRALELRGE